MNSIIEIKNLCKKYGNKAALSDFCLDINENGIYGLLGRNGAGKTTLLNTLAGIETQSSGSIHIFGNTHSSQRSLNESLCYVMEDSNFNQGLKVKEILGLAAMQYSKWDAEFAKKLIRDFSIDPNLTYNKLSKGLKTIVGNIIGLSSNSPIVIYDESYSGLDAFARKQFNEEMISNYSEHPKIVIMSSHLIEETNRLFDNIIILKEGRLLLFDSTENLASRCYAINGRKEEVEAFTKSMNVLKMDYMGSIVSAQIMNRLTDENLIDLRKRNLTYEMNTLQSMFIAITEKAV